MKTIKLLFLVAFALCAKEMSAQLCSNFKYFHEGISWGEAEGYQIINFKASEVPTDLYPTGAADGSADNLNYPNDPKAPYGSGEIETPLYAFDEETYEYYPSGQTYKIKYSNCVFAPTHRTSAYTKIEINGGTASGSTDCTKNDNTVLVGDVYSMVGFIEMNRKGTLNDGDTESSLGYVQLDGLKKVERIQWAFSSTAWQRGVMVEKKYADEDEWTIVRSLPSNIGSPVSENPWGHAIFADQGYQFEERDFDMNSDKELSVRFRVWDGDSRSFAQQYEMGEINQSEGQFYREEDPMGTWQVARIHQIIVYSTEPVTTGIQNNYLTDFTVRNIDSVLKLSEEGTAEIYTIDGKLVRTAVGTDINVSDLNSGVYVVKATSQSGITKNVKVAL